MISFKKYINESRNKADYVYKNKDDTIRIRIFKELEWDYDVYVKLKGGYDFTYSSEAGDLFRTKKEALKEAESQYGKLKSMGNINPINKGW